MLESPKGNKRMEVADIINVTVGEQSRAASKDGPHSFPFALGDFGQRISVPILLGAAVHPGGGSSSLVLSTKHSRSYLVGGPIKRYVDRCGGMWRWR